MPPQDCGVQEIHRAMLGETYRSPSHSSQHQVYDVPHEHYRSPPREPHATGRSPQHEDIRRRRRRRVAIHIPHELLPHLDKEEIKKWKNRVAAARARQRTQNEVQGLKVTVEQLHEASRQQRATIEKLRAVIRSLEPRCPAGYGNPWYPAARCTTYLQSLHLQQSLSSMHMPTYGRETSSGDSLDPQHPTSWWNHPEPTEPMPPAVPSLNHN